MVRAAPGQQDAAPLSDYLPHSQMPRFQEPADTVLTAVRLTFARGLTQVTLSKNHAPICMPVTSLLRGAAGRCGGCMCAHCAEAPCCWLRCAPAVCVQVLGNETLAHASSPRASYAFTDGEALTRLTVWNTARSLDGATATPLVGARGGAAAAAPIERDCDSRHCDASHPCSADRSVCKSNNDRRHAQGFHTAIHAPHTHY